jgi:arylsulfatase A
MKIKFFFTIIIVTFLLATCQRSSMDHINDGPNVLLILVDDMGYGDASGAGNTYLKTPHLDELASKSVAFKYFYVSPVCAPTRASLLTGRYHQEVNVRSVTNGFETMDPEAVTLAEILKTAGYRTAIFGKWHLGEYYPSVPNAQGFDEYLGFRTGHTSDYYDAVLEHNGKEEATSGYITDMFSERALEWMNTDSEDPFFCYLAYNAPHSPLQVDSVYFKKFLEMGLNDKTSRVYGMVENIDENIGRILANLEQSGRLNNTMVIFLSDNGPISGWKVPQEKMRYNAGLRDQKFTTYEGGVRTQCYWMWKGKWAPFYDTASIAAHIDVLPTICNLLSIDLPDSLSIDGYDLSNVLTLSEPIDEQRTFFEDFELDALETPGLFKGGIARQAEWKMVRGTELYHLGDDHAESYNLALTNPGKLNELKEAYKSFYDKVYANGYVKPLPIKVGYDEENPVHLKSHHGRASGNVKFMGFRGHYGELVGAHPTGVDGDWTGNWKQEGDGMQWDVEFVEDAKYEIGITANGKLGISSCVIKISINEKNTEVILPEFDPSRDWTYISLMKVMESGAGEVTLNLRNIAKKDSLNINELVITKIN